MKVSLCITTYNRFVQTHSLFRDNYHNPLIDEIVISDDTSTWGNDYERLRVYQSFGKLTLRKNPENVGALKNKHAAVSAARNEWCVVFDSDNKLTPTYIKFGRGAVLSTAEATRCQTIFCPARALPEFDYRGYIGQVVDLAYVRANWSPLMETFLNTANYLVNRKEFLSIAVDGDYKSYESLYFASQWLLKGNQFVVVEGMEYFHDTTSPDGVYRKYAHESETIKRDILNKLLYAT